MAFEKIDYASTNSFSRLVLDYVQGKDVLKPFYAYEQNDKGLKESIEAREVFEVNRLNLVEALEKQYAGFAVSEKVLENIQLLRKKNSFTVTTAHQPNIFTGHLYFVYKILHAVKLAQYCKDRYPEYDFVPVYYMGNEDADLEELGMIEIEGRKYRWETPQNGAVGKMVIDKPFINLINEIEGRLGVEEFGFDVVDELRKHYAEGKTIEEATFGFVNALFGRYGLIVLLPDVKELKQGFVGLAKIELSDGFSAEAVKETIVAFPEEYKVQAAGRDINLFYLDDNLRERIEKDEEGFYLADGSKRFSTEELFKELEVNPEKISPNVILRPVYQELILPDIAFIGGGGELAYWLELKKVFAEANVFFPLLVLRNSFALVEPATKENIDKLGLSTKDLFIDDLSLAENIILKNAFYKLDLDAERLVISQGYEAARATAEKIDKSLVRHISALETQSLKKLNIAQKKMLRAEKRNQTVSMQRLHEIKNKLYPGGILQERVDNILIYLSKYGFSFTDKLLEASNSIEPSFTMINVEN